MIQPQWPGRTWLEHLDAREALQRAVAEAQSLIETYPFVADASTMDASSVPTVSAVGDEDGILVFDAGTGTSELITVEDFMGALQTVMETCERMLSQMNSRLYSFQSSLTAGPAMRVDGSGATVPVTGTVAQHFTLNTLPIAMGQQLLAAEVRKQVVTS